MELFGAMMPSPSLCRSSSNPARHGVRDGVNSCDRPVAERARRVRRRSFWLVTGSDPGAWDDRPGLVRDLPGHQRRHVYEAGDSRKKFAIQSISKPFTYALALADRGLAAVAAKVDVEPSGEPFNEISLDPVTERPRNPMINAGAITSASLVAGATVAERFERIRRFYSRFAGRELTLNE